MLEFKHLTLIETFDKNRLITLIEFLQNPRYSDNLLPSYIEQLGKNDKPIFDAQFSFTLDRILMESEDNFNFFTVMQPLIEQYIPTNILQYFNCNHATKLLDQLLSFSISSNDTKETIVKKIVESFSSVDLNIPVQGLRNAPANLEIIRYGVFAPLLFKPLNIKNVTSKSSTNTAIAWDVVKSMKQDSTNPEKDRLLPKLILMLRLSDAN